MESDNKSDIYLIVKILYEYISKGTELYYNKYNPVPGYIYCLYNEMFNYYGSDVFKLGCTENLEKRMHGYTTSYFEQSFYKVISNILCDKKMAERILFNKLKIYRMGEKREFFKCDYDKIKKAFQEIQDFFTEYDTKEKLIEFAEKNLDNYRKEYQYNLIYKIGVKYNNVDIIKLDHYRDYVNGNMKDEKIIKTIEFLLSKLKINKDNKFELAKYETIICDGGIQDHYNLCTLIKKTNILRTKIENNIENQMSSNLVRCKYSKALLLHNIEKLLGITTLDIDSKKYEVMYDKVIEIPDSIYKSYIDLYKGKRKKPEKWIQCYNMLIAGYKSLIGNLNIITSKIIYKKIKGKSKKFTSYNLDKNTLRFNLELLNSRISSISKYQDYVFILVGLNLKVEKSI